MRNKHIGSSFEDFLEAEGIADEVTGNAVKKLLAYQLLEKLEKENMTKSELAARLSTSRSAVDRILDPNNESITLTTLQKVAEVLGKKLKIELV
ncbi:MAG: helix-turn-helix transcriptional regulator [Rectinemataceae bacterium]|nr:helix-turn-helix transcriptional regulator [Rectinemataceae bacterium]